MQARGGTNIPIRVGEIDIPLKTAKLVQFRTNRIFQPIEFVPLATVPRGTRGVHFMHTLSVLSNNMNFLEGCYHVYFGESTWPGLVLSTGTEDYFDSAWYFSAGQFHQDVSGFTHLEQADTGVQWSAYRFHETDVLQFDDGFQLDWRNGDVLDGAGIKCYALTGETVGIPGPALVKAYAWVYTF